jgi:hypothetical protein
MADNKRGVILTLADGLSAMAPYAGGSVPSDTTPEFDQWVRWLQLGQQDAYNRGFWGRDLVKADLTIEANDDEVDLPDDFGKRNGIYVLLVGDVDWNARDNEEGQRLLVYLDTTTAPFKWKVKFVGFTPTTAATATLWYFKNPPVPTAEDDEFAYDGEMIMFYALKEYFRKARQPGSLDDARVEYENRRDELMALEVLPTPQEIISWSSYPANIGHTMATERNLYRGFDRRRRR